MLWPFSSKESSLEEDRERLRLLTRQTLLALLGNLGNMAVITLVLWPVVSHTLLTGWTTLNGVVTLLRLGLWWPRRQEKALDSLSQAELLSQARLFTSLAAVSGLLWGLVPVVLFPEGNFIYQAFMAFLIGGLTAGVIASYGVVSWLAPAFFLPVCLPLAGRFYLETSEISFTAGSLVLLFTLVALALSRNVHLITMQAIRLAVEKDGLLETLARAKEETEALNRELMAEIEERVALEKASHEAEAREERLRALAEAVPLPLLVVGKDGRHLLYANEPSRELFGLGEMKPGKIGIDSLYANQEQWNEVVRTVEAEGLISGAVHVLKKPDGREFQAIVNGQPMLFGGEPALMFGIFDLTSELEAGAEARTSRRLLRVVVDTVPHWIYLKDSQERYVMVNRSMARDFDMEPEQFIGRVYADFSLAAGEEVMLLSRADNQVLERNTPVELEEVDFRRADGRLMKRHEIKLPWHDDESRVRGVVGVSMDITERQAAEMELKESEQRYRDLIEGSLQGIVIHREFQPLFVNQAFADILGFASSRDVLSLGSLRSYLMPGDDVSGQVVDIPAENTGQNREIKTVQGTEIKTVQGTEIKTVQGTELNSGEKKARVIEMDVVNNKGTPLRLQCFMMEIMWEGSPAVLSACVDITERTRLEAQLRQSQKMEAVGQLAGGVAHDFNNILQVIYGYAMMSLEEKGLSPRVEENIKLLIKATDGAANLTRQLLAFSRREVIQPQPVDVNFLITGQLKILRRLIGETIQMDFRPCPSPVMVHADQGMLEQVFLNLALNSRDAMSDGGTLSVAIDVVTVDREFREQNSWVDTDQYVLVSFADTGEGIQKELQPHIFEPFFTTKEIGKGSGLGLSMVYGIMRQHKGMVKVESDTGRGAVFKLYLPRIELSELPVTEKAESLTDLNGTGTVLLAEDEERVRILLAGLLEKAGYSVIQAPNGEEALKMFSAAEPRVDLVVLDMVMPGMGGREVVEKLHEKEPDLPIILCTGYPGQELSQEFLEKHSLSLIRKPFMPVDLLRTLRDVSS